MNVYVCIRILADYVEMVRWSQYSMYDYVPIYVEIYSCGLLHIRRWWVFLRVSAVTK